MKKIREIIRLNETAGMSRRKIAGALGISRPVVTQYLNDFAASGLTYEETVNMADSELLAWLQQKKADRCPAYRALTEQFAYFDKELKRTGVTRRILWEEYRRDHPNGYSYSQFCHHFQVWKNASEVSMHIDHKAGDKMFVDYAGDSLVIVNSNTGEQESLEVFIAVLGASQLTYVQACASQKAEDWIRANEHALWYFGGVPAAIVSDNLKSAVNKPSKYEPGINDLFDDFARHYQTVILPTRVRKARDKALVENAVRLVYQRIYAPLRNRTFYSLEELNQAIQDLLEPHNNASFQRLNTSRRQLFEDVERQSLRPLPVERYPLKDFRTLKVQYNYHIELRDDRHYYSVPWQLKGNRVKVIYDDRNVAIYYDNIRVAQHRRDRTPNGYSTLPIHMPESHRRYADWTPERFLSWAESIGKDVAKVIEKVLESRSHPEQAFRVCMGILNLAKDHGPGRLDKACKRALAVGVYSYKRIKSILDHGLEKEAQLEFQLAEQQVPSHENIRGSSYYQ